MAFGLRVLAINSLSFAIASPFGCGIGKYELCGIPLFPDNVQAKCSCSRVTMSVILLIKSHQSGDVSAGTSPYCRSIGAKFGDAILVVQPFNA